MKKIFLFLIFFYFSLNAISKETFKDCDFCPEMVQIEPGKFTMGSSLEESGHTDEKPQREVNINYGFAVSKYEITYNIWDLCQNDGACPESDDAGFGRDNYPVINISWNDANTFINWLNKKSNQKNLGTIKSSNLCVAPETLVLTENGHEEIQYLKDKKDL